MKDLMRYQILEILKEAGEKGVHSFYFYKSFKPTFSQRIGELVKEGYPIKRVNRGSKGAMYYYTGNQ